MRIVVIHAATIASIDRTVVSTIEGRNVKQEPGQCPVLIADVMLSKTRAAPPAHFFFQQERVEGGGGRLPPNSCDRRGAPGGQNLAEQQPL